MRAALILALLPVPALADPCADRLALLLARDLTADGPYVAQNVNDMAGMRMEFRQSFLSDQHFLIEQVDPPGQPDTLHYRGAAWTADGAGGWTLAWRMDPEEAQAGIVALRQSLSDGVLSATCTTEDREGRTLDRIDGTVGETPTFGPELAVTLLVEPESDRVAEIVYDYDLNGMAVLATFAIERAPDLDLPVPPAE